LTAITNCHIFENLPDTYARFAQERRIADSTAALGRAEAVIQAREAAVRAEAVCLIADQDTALGRSLDSYTARRDARLRQAEERERITAAFAAMPDPDAPGPPLTARPMISPAATSPCIRRPIRSAMIPSARGDLFRTSNTVSAHR
jgi:hypothetical protein